MNYYNVLNPKLDIKMGGKKHPSLSLSLLSYGVSNKTILIVNHNIIQQVAQSAGLTADMLFSPGSLLGC